LAVLAAAFSLASEALLDAFPVGAGVVGVAGGEVVAPPPAPPVSWQPAAGIRIIVAASNRANRLIDLPQVMNSRG
jgi:hypothetical protein